MKLAAEIEDAMMEAKTLRSSVLAVHDAIYNGCNSYEEFEGALHAVFCMAHEHSEHLESLTDRAYGEIRKGGE